MFKSGNLRKNFLRVKQIADQNLGRVEKTEVLSDDLQSAEKKVDLVKNVCSLTVKKLSSSLVAFGTTDKEKRLKKMPEAVISQSMKDSASALTTEGTMGYYSQMFEMCGECQSFLAMKHLQFELDVEKNVLDPMQDIVENEIPHITKLKKALNKVILDMDSARNRVNSAIRQSHAPGVNLQKASAQADIIKEACTEAENKVEQAKDAYTTALFTFISKEADYSQNLLNLLIAQQEYHRDSLAVLDSMIPELKEGLSCNPTKPIYGVPLAEHLRVSKCDIAVVLKTCVNYLLEEGLEEEGLFRIAGMASKVKKLKALFDAKLPFDDMASEIDAHTVAGALKQYLRELPEPLLTFALFKDFVAAAQQPENQRLQALWCVIDKLPKPNYDNFRYLIKFLAKLVEKSDVNKMTASNISIVIGPNLIWSQGDTGPNMLNTGILSLITELIVLNADWFFPGDINFACGSSAANGSPHLNQLESHQDISVTRVTPDQSSSAGVVLQSSPAILQEPVVQTSPQMPHISLQSVSLSQPTTNVSVTAVAESENLLSNLRKLARKPAPPPPERPFSVAVLADMKPSQQAPQYPTWPRQGVPLEEDIAMDLESTQKEKKPIVPDKPSLPEHFSSLPGHGQSGRPKIPPPVVTSRHHRSASTGTPLGIPGSQLHHILNREDFTGRTVAGHWNQSKSESQYSQTNQQIPLLADKHVSSSVNKQSSAHPHRQSSTRPPRPLPSTPPSENTEQTHL